MLHVGHQTVVQFVALAEHAEHLDSGSHHGGRQRVGEKIGARTLAQHVDDLLAARREPPHGTSEGLAQRAGQDVDLSAQVVKFGDAAARLAQNTGRMALVDHHQSVVFLSQGADLVQRSGIAVHREDPVGADDAETLRLRFLETLLQFGHVGIGITIAHGLAQTHAVDDRGMVQRIGNDGVLLREKGFENAAVGIEAGGIENRILRTEIVRHGLFQLLVHVLAAADETHRRHAVTTGVHRLFRRFDQPRIVRKTQVVVGTEVQHLAARHFDLGPLGRLDHAFRLVETRGLDFGQFVLQVFLDFTVHVSYF